MNREEVEARVREVTELAGDDEAAHGAEDRLHRDVLRAIADGDGPDAGLAREALRTVDLEFKRWCA